MNYFQRLWTLLLVCAVLSDTDGATGQGTNQTCRDVDPHCENYANICAPNVRNWAQQYCAKFCGLCTVSATTTPTLPRPTTKPPVQIIQNVFCMNVDGISCAGSGLKVICGNDGQLYPNNCEFAKARCKNPHLTRVNVTASHCSTPRTTTTTPTLTSSTVATTKPTVHVIQNVFCMHADGISCATDVGTIICGSDGTLYPNQCEFAKAHCKNPSLTRLKVSASHCPKPGSTPRTTKSTTPSTTTSTTPSTRPSTTVHAPACQDLYLGSCEHDYGGRCKEPLISKLCQKTCGACHDSSETTSPTLTSSTVATTKPPVQIIQNVFCMNADSISCAASGRDVICGSDGTLYTNQCEFAKAHCKNPSLKRDTVSQCTTPVLG